MERSQAARKTSALTTTFVALLRGVNVGGANRLTMAALQAAFADAGGRKVETLLQSGNVVFEAAAGAGEAVAARARASLTRALDIDAPIVLRDGDGWLNSSPAIHSSPLAPTLTRCTRRASPLRRPPTASRGSSPIVRRLTPSSSSAPRSISACPTASRAAS